MQGSKLSIRATAPVQPSQNFASAKIGYSAPQGLSSGYGSGNAGIVFDKKAVNGVVSSAVKTSSNIDYSQFKANTTVEHKKFGRGLIVAVEGEGENKTATIMFRQLGIKRFSLSIAAPHLTIIKE